MREWKEYSLGELTIWRSGGTPSKKNPEYWDGDIPWISASSMTGTRYSDSSSYITELGLENGSRLARKNDILLLVRGSGLFNEISVGIATKEIAFNQDVKAISVKKEIINPWYLLFWFIGNRKKLSHLLEETGIGAGKFDIETLKNLIVTVPEPREQDEILKLAKGIDDKIILLQHQNQTLEKIAQTLFKHWFIDFEFPNDEGKPYRSSGGKMVASDFGEVPEGWYGSEIGELIKTLGGGTPSTSEPEYWIDGQILWYSPTDLTKSGNLFSLTSEKKITNKGLQKSSAKLFPAYSIMMTSRATVGEIAINTKEACTNQGFITLIPNDDLPLGFLFGWLKTQLKKVKSLASGSTFPELSKGDFREFEILVPRQKVVLKYEKIVSPLLSKIENNTIEIQTLTKTRDTLLPKLMSGQIRIQEAEKQIP